MNTLRAQLAALVAQLQIAVAKLQAQLNKTMPPLSQRIYIEAVASIGKHMTLNEAVAAETGCMEAVSAILALAGVSDGPQGIAGTYTGLQWLEASPLFKEAVGTLQSGDIVMYASGTGNGSIEGHVLIVGDFDKKYPKDFTLLSNQSSSGLFEDQWSASPAAAYYENAGGIPRRLFRAV